MIITNNPETIQTMNVRIAAGDVSGSIDYIRQVFRKYRDNREFSYTFLEDLLNEKYLPEKRLRNITAGFAGLAVVISILGILGMAVFSTHRRTKEIGIRRVSGARNLEIMILLNREFIKLVLAGFIIALPAAWLSMNSWLQNFAFRIRSGWLILLLSGTAALIFALVAVSWHTWKAANRNPVESLRYE
jgi:putative ABC transport system permease protein